MKTKAVLFAVLLIALLLVAGTALAHPQNLRAHLSASEGVDTNGQGQAKFQLNDSGELSFVLALSRQEGDPLAAHIHYATEPGGTGAPVISLCGAFGPPPIPVTDCGGPGHPAKGSVALTADQIDELMTAVEENRAYVNVHTTAHTASAIRGPVEPNN